MVDINIDITPQVNVISTPLRRKLPLRRAACVFMNVADSQRWQLWRQMFAKCAGVTFSSSEWNNLFWTSSIIWVLWQDTHARPPLPSSVFLLSLSFLRIKKQTESQMNPMQFLSSAAIHILDRARLGKSLELFTPNTPTPPSSTTIAHPHLPSTSPPPLPSSSYSSSFFLSSPKWDAHVWSPEPICRPMWHPSLQTWALCLPLLAKRRGIIFIPQTRGYAPMISNACLAHCQGWFGPSAKPIILISLSLYFNSHGQCRFTAEHIREIKISLRN